MDVVVGMAIERQGIYGVGPEQFPIGRRRQHPLGRALAADMAVQAHHAVRGAHYHVQLMADHQHRAAHFAPHALDLAIEVGGAAVIEALGGLVEQQQVGLLQQGSSEQDALELPAGEIRHLLSAQSGDAGAFQGLTQRLSRMATRQVQKAGDRHRQGGIDGQPLGHVADGEARLAHEPAAGRPHGADDGAQQGRLAGAVGADQGDDLTAVEAQVDALENGSPAENDMQVIEREQWHGDPPVSCRAGVGWQGRRMVLTRSLML